MAQILSTQRHGLNLKFINNFSGVTTTADVKPPSRCQLLLKLLPELALKPKWATKAGVAFTDRKEWHYKSPDSPATCDLHWHLVHRALPAHPMGRCCSLMSRGIGWKLAKMWVQKLKISFSLGYEFKRAEVKHHFARRFWCNVLVIAAGYGLPSV